MKKYLTTIVLTMTIPIGEIHKHWSNDTRVQNWVLCRYVPMSIEWNVKFVEIQVIGLMYLLACKFYYPSRVNKVVVRAFVFLMIADIVMLFWNWKTYGYFGIYLWFAGCLALSYWWKDITNYLWEPIKHWGRKSPANDSEK